MTLSAPSTSYGQPQFHRTLLVSLLAVITIVLSAILVVLGLLAALIVGAAGLVLGFPELAAVGVMGGLFASAVGAVGVVVGLGLWRQRTWAWWLALIVDALIIVAVASPLRPVAMALAIFFLLYLAAVKKYFG